MRFMLARTGRTFIGLTERRYRLQNTTFVTQVVVEFRPHYNSLQPQL